MRPARSTSIFGRFAKSAARVAGRPVSFLVALALIIVWALLGPLFGFSDTWQLVINTTTTIITFLMVFVIQNSQNRDSEATQIKLDELLRAIKEADNRLMDLEELEEKELDGIRAGYEKIAEDARSASRKKRT